MLSVASSLPWEVLTDPVKFKLQLHTCELSLSRSFISTSNPGLSTVKIEILNDADSSENSLEIDAIPQLHSYIAPEEPVSRSVTHAQDVAVGTAQHEQSGLETSDSHTALPIPSGDLEADGPCEDKLTFVYNPETHAVYVFNAAYGGFGWSKLLRDEYYSSLSPTSHEYLSGAGVASAHLLASIGRIGSLEACEGPCCGLVCALVPKVAADCVVREEYDGKQRIYIDRSLYLEMRMEQMVLTQAVIATTWNMLKQEAQNLSLIQGEEVILNNKTCMIFCELPGPTYMDSLFTGFHSTRTQVHDKVCDGNLRTGTPLEEEE